MNYRDYFRKFLTIEIAGEVHSSKNSRLVVHGKYAIKSKAAKADESMFAEQLAIQKSTWEEMVEGEEFPYYVTFIFFRRTRARWDFTNLVQGISDAMVKAGYIPDDDVEHFIPVYGGHEVDKLKPGVVFYVKK